jgi:beta-fructofuranosidase
MKAYTSNDNHDLHTPLLNSSQKPSKVIFVTFGSIVFLMSMVALIIIQSQNSLQKLENITPLTNISLRPELPRGVAQGVSAKSNPSHFNEISYNWTNAMFSWQRTAFHFQPQKNWMNGKCTLA